MYRPAVLRANRVAAVTGDIAAALPPQLKFHALRHTYASLMIAAGRPMFEIARFMGHAKPSTTETVYAHLIAYDHSDAMDALGALAGGRCMQKTLFRLWDRRASFDLGVQI